MSYMDSLDKELEVSMEALSTQVLESIAKEDSDFLTILVEHIKDTHFGKIYENDDILIEANTSLGTNVAKTITNVLTNNIQYYNTIGQNINKFKEGVNKGLLLQAGSPNRKVGPIEVKIHKTSLFLLEQKGHVNLLLTNSAMDHLVVAVDRILKLMEKRPTVGKGYDFSKLQSQLDDIATNFYNTVLGKEGNKEDFRKAISKISNKEMKEVTIDDLQVLKKLEDFLDRAHNKYDKTIIRNNNKLNDLVVTFEKSKISVVELKKSELNPKTHPDLAAVNKFDRICYNMIYTLIRDTKIAITYDITILNNAIDDVRRITNAVIKSEKEVETDDE